MYYKPALVRQVYLNSSVNLIILQHRTRNLKNREEKCKFGDTKTLKLKNFDLWLSCGVRRPLAEDGRRSDADVLTYEMKPSKPLIINVGAPVVKPQCLRTYLTYGRVFVDVYCYGRIRREEGKGEKKKNIISWYGRPAVRMG